MREFEFTSEAAYEGNIGMMEMFKFKQMASPEMWALMKKLIATNQQDKAWELLKKVTGVKLKDVELTEELFKGILK